MSTKIFDFSFLDDIFYVDNNKAVRNMMLQRGIVPENLPAGEDIKKVERRLKSDEKTLTKKNSKKK